MVLDGIKNIIFDLGGVILNLSVASTHEAFSQLSGLPLEEIQKRVHHGVYFHKFERGAISPADFRKHLRESLGMQASDAEIDAAWNTMLLDIPKTRLALLEHVKKTHATFLLSNTNAIHLERFNRIVQQTSGVSRIDDYFHKAYFSHHLKMSKPDPEIYEHVLRENHLKAAETIFLDDNLDNLKGAQRTGIRTYHIENPDQIFSLFA